MLTKQRRHFSNARTIGGSLSNGSGIVSDIISKVSSIASSSAAKQLGKCALEGATKGVKAGSEYAAKKGVETIVNKVTKKSRPKVNKVIESDVQTITKELPKLSTNKKQVIDAGTRSMLDKLKRGSEQSERLLKVGSGIKILN